MQLAQLIFGSPALPPPFFLAATVVLRNETSTCTPRSKPGITTSDCMSDCVVRSKILSFSVAPRSSSTSSAARSSASSTRSVASGIPTPSYDSGTACANQYCCLSASDLNVGREGQRTLAPIAEHVVGAFRRLPEKHKLALLFLDWSGARVAAIDHTNVGDYDEPRRRVRLRKATTKSKRALWIDLPEVLAEAIEATLPHPRFRDPEARLFADSGADALRTAIAKACTAAGVAVFSPHDLRHRRISLLHARGVPWARIAQFVGQRKLSVTADTYTHVLMDEAEIDYAALLAA
jgi:hypothetical protein